MSLERKKKVEMQTELNKMHTDYPEYKKCAYKII